MCRASATGTNLGSAQTSVHLADCLQCPETHQACFCTTACQQAAESEPGAPSLAVRRALAQVPWSALDADQQQQARVLVQALPLKQHAAAWGILTDTGGNVHLPQARQQQLAQTVRAVRQAVCSAEHSAACPTEEELMQVLLHDASNGYGILAGVTPEV